MASKGGESQVFFSGCNREVAAMLSKLASFRQSEKLSQALGMHMLPYDFSRAVPKQELERILFPGLFASFRRAFSGDRDRLSSERIKTISEVSFDNSRPSTEGRQTPKIGRSHSV